MNTEASDRPCPDCAVKPGAQHQDGCDVALCVGCGQQALQCGAHLDTPMQTWTGVWPGEVECREWGWWARWTIVTEYSTDGRPDSGPLVPCSVEHPDARTDLNRLAVAGMRGEVVWSRERERYVRRH